MTDERSTTRPATIEDLRTVIHALNAHGVPYLLIGGYALAVHGYVRGTTDIDIVFPATATAGALVRQALSMLPDKAAADIDPAWFEEGENIRILDEFVIDLMLNANGQTFETLTQFAQTVDFDGLPLHTNSLEGLLLTKQTARSKDVLDRSVLERAISELRALDEARPVDSDRPKN